MIFQQIKGTLYYCVVYCVNTLFYSYFNNFSFIFYLPLFDTFYVSSLTIMNVIIIVLSINVNENVCFFIAINKLVLIHFFKNTTDIHY